MGDNERWNFLIGFEAMKRGLSSAEARLLADDVGRRTLNLTLMLCREDIPGRARILLEPSADCSHFELYKPC
jgi:hypothetical protein